MDSLFGIWYRLTPRGEAGLSCCRAGVALGPISLIAAREGRYHLRPDRDLAEAFALAYGSLSPETFMRWHAGLTRIAKALEHDEDALAAIVAVQLGFPAIAPAAMAKLARSPLAKAYDPDQPRVPAGNDGAGEWTNDGGAGVQVAEDDGVQSNTPKYDAATMKRARVVYGETAGLRPQLLNPNGNLNDPQNWDRDSSERLATGRVYVGIVSERNPGVWSAQPTDLNNPIQAQAWSAALDAAKQGADGSQLDKRITNFFFRQDGVGVQRPPSWRNKTLYLSIGPFNNVGGGDAPRGSKTYIDFYYNK